MVRSVRVPDLGGRDKLCRPASGYLFAGLCLAVGLSHQFTCWSYTCTSINTLCASTAGPVHALLILPAHLLWVF